MVCPFSLIIVHHSLINMDLFYEYIELYVVEMNML